MSHSQPDSVLSLRNPRSDEFEGLATCLATSEGLHCDSRFVFVRRDFYDVLVENRIVSKAYAAHNDLKLFECELLI